MIPPERFAMASGIILLVSFIAVVAGLTGAALMIESASRKPPRRWNGRR